MAIKFMESQSLRFQDCQTFGTTEFRSWDCQTLKYQECRTLKFWESLNSEVLYFDILGLPNFEVLGVLNYVGLRRWLISFSCKYHNQMKQNMQICPEYNSCSFISDS